MKKIKLALSGIGGYGHIYVDALLPVLAAPDADVEVIGCADPFPQACTRLDDIRALGIPVFDSLDELYAAGSPDLTVISSPIALHTPQIKLALAHGSNVLCEKPLCGDANDIPSLIAAREAAGKFVAIGYQWSHSDAMLALKGDILAGRFGAPLALKTIALWPRDERYFRRGTGWAGRIHNPDGALVLDSVANNATAHYLHNMFFVLGAEGGASGYSGLTAELHRANHIENFDTCVLRCKTDSGADVLYVASHAVDSSLGPVFEYRFERGTVSYSSADGFVRASFADGGEQNYGNPEATNTAKLWRAISLVRDGGTPVCGIEAASTQSRVIRELYDRFEIVGYGDAVKVNERGVSYVPGLFDELKSMYDEA